jgi:hypothetical protein
MYVVGSGGHSWLSKYTIVKRILFRRVSEVELGIRVCKINWTPSFSCGRISVVTEGEKENQTALGRLQWKKRYASSLTDPQAEQRLSMRDENIAALSAVGRALRIILQVKVLMIGGSQTNYVCLAIASLLCEL